MKNIFTTAIFAFIMVIGLNVNAQSYDFETLASGATGSFTNGWVGSPTTNYSWIADAGGTISGGTGPAVDHTVGTAAGIYMYVEASTPAIAGDTASLTSPNITLTGSQIGFSFWYHRAGTSMGNMYIDVFNGTSWVLGVDSLIGPDQAVETDPWINKVTSLAAFSGTVKVKFRAVCGASWSGDMAIDDVSMVVIPPYDAVLESIVPSTYYYMYPQSQIQPMNFSGLVKSGGTGTITNVTVDALVNGTTSLTGNIASIITGVTDTVVLSTSYTPTTIGLYTADFNVSIAETDPNLLNDSAKYAFEVTDTVFSRENDNVTQGIGFTGATGVFGQMFEVFTADSLTSVSFKLTGPTLSDNIKLKLYAWDSTTGTPGALMDSTANFSIPSIASAWYTLQFPCDRILAPGKYFFAVEQIATNNLTMGYTSEYYEPGVTWYDGGATGWASFESVGFNVALAIRPNFGPASWPTVDLGNDTVYCAGSSVTITAPAGWSSYLWENGTTTAANAISSVDTTWVRVTDGRGCPAFDTIIVGEIPSPAILMPPTIGICNGDTARLVANNDPTYTYIWDDGSTDSVFVISIAGTYGVSVTNGMGCMTSGTSTVQVGSPFAQITVDTAVYCAGLDVTVNAAVVAGYVYAWSNGTSGDSTVINQPGTFFLTVTAPGGCMGYDTAFAIEKPTPSVILTTNALQFCDNVVGSVSVNTITGASYLWSSGDTTSSISITNGGQYWVETTLLGCIASDTGMAVRLSSPIVNLGLDTTICDTVILVLDGGPGSFWTWSNGASTQTINVNTANDYSVITENSDGCKGYDTVTVAVDICTSINDIVGIENVLNAYPNPASDVVYLMINKELLGSELTIVDMKGTAIYSGEVTDEKMTINVTDFTDGLYLVKVSKVDLSYTLKIIVKH